MSKRRIPATWPLLLLALPAGVATWSGWVGLGELTGFGPVKPLPGISEFTINTAITLPIGVEAYAGYALHAWLSSRNAAEGTRRFAKYSALGALVLGMLGQVAYHLLAVRGVTTAPWQVTTAVSCLPVLVLGMGAALGHMLARDAHAAPAGVQEWTPAQNYAGVPTGTGTATGAPAPVDLAPVDPWEPSRLAADKEANLPLFPEVVEPVEVHLAAVPVQVTAPGEVMSTHNLPDEVSDVPDIEVQPETVPGPDPLYPLALVNFLSDVTVGEVPSVRTIKSRMSVGTDRARDLQAYLGGLVKAAS